MAELHSRFGDDYAYRQAGKFVLSNAAPDRAGQDNEQGGNRWLSRAEAIDREPALATLTHDWAGGFFALGDEVGDPRAFSQRLIDHLRSVGVDVRFGCTVHTLRTADRSLQQVDTSQGPLAADAAVICTGIDAPRLYRPLGIRTPLQPVTGYSVTLPATEGAPMASITLPDDRIVFARLGDRLRIAGFADVGRAPSADERIATLLDIARRRAPGFADYDAAEVHPWMGRRPSTPSSLPLVGRTPVRGAYVNCGHGMYGWTLAAATAETVTARIIEDLADGGGSG